MADMSCAKKILIVFTLIVYIVHLIFNGVSNIKGGLFPNTTSEVSQEFTLPITPAGATFAIWGFIFAYQLVWLGYCISTICRKGDATNILSANFFVLFIANVSLIVVWLLVWSRSNIVGSLVVIILAQIFLDGTILTAVLDLNKFLEIKSGREGGKVDILCQRLLVQNGLFFYATWTTIATLLNTAAVIAYKLGSSPQTASFVVLSILLVLLVIWFGLENFVFENYLRLIFTEYLVIIVAGAGILVKNWRENPETSKLVLAILILAVIFLVARIVLIVIREKRRSVIGERRGARKP